MNEYSKANLLFPYLNKFIRKGVYFSLDKRVCTSLFLQNFDLFREQLNQDITDVESALKMFDTLSTSILKSYVWEKRDNKLWQVEVNIFDDKHKPKRIYKDNNSTIAPKKSAKPPERRNPKSPYSPGPGPGPNPKPKA
jgi:hypothetical protein